MLATTLSMGAALVGTGWSSYRGIRESAEALARGQGERILQDLRFGLQTSYGPPSREMLEALLEEGRDDGLVLVALYTPEGRLLQQAGAAILAQANQQPALAIQLLGGL